MKMLAIRGAPFLRDENMPDMIGVVPSIGAILIVLLVAAIGVVLIRRA